MATRVRIPLGLQNGLVTHVTRPFLPSFKPTPRGGVAVAMGSLQEQQTLVFQTLTMAKLVAPSADELLALTQLRLQPVWLSIRPVGGDAR